jgi:hypothetical protein
VEIDDLPDQFITAEFGVRRPEITAGDNKRGRPARRLHHAAQGFVRVKADDEVVVICHRSIESFDPDRNSLKAPAAGIDEFGLIPVMLPQNPG